MWRETYFNEKYTRVAFAWLIIVAAFVFAPQTGQAQWQEQSCGWPHRIPVTLTIGPVTQTEEIRIDLTNANFPADYVFSASGNDVRVMRGDDLTPIDFAVTSWNSVSRSATLYIRPASLPTNSTETIYIYVGDNSLNSNSSPTIVFPDTGVRLHSRVSTVDPTSSASALSAFAAATVDVYNAVRTSVTGLNNQALGGTNGDFGWCISAVLEVTSATSGTWNFRYGADFGLGGHLFVNGQPLEQDWNNDLWWAGNYANTSDTLSGSISLVPGWHRYEAVGFEGCCDGTVGFQARRPGGAWKDLSSSNFSLRASQCVNSNVTVSINTAESCSKTLTAEKGIEMADASPFDYALPGAIVSYELDVSNPGQKVSKDTIILTDVFPAELALVTTGANIFEFVDGPIASGLSLTFDALTSQTDDVEFSTDGTDFTYVPKTPTDDLITHIRFKPKGTLNPNQGGDKPSFSIRLLGKIL